MTGFLFAWPCFFLLRRFPIPYPAPYAFFSGRSGKGLYEDYFITTLTIFLGTTMTFTTCLPSRYF